MVNKSETVKRFTNKIEVTDPKQTNTHIQYSVWYCKGENFTGRPRPRGFYITVVPMQAKNGFEIVYAYSGIISLLEEVKRFSEKKLSEIWQNLHSTNLSVLKSVIAKVAEDSNLQVDLEKVKNG